MDNSDGKTRGEGGGTNYRDLISVSRPLFFSSTFRDMRIEQDLQRHAAFPELSEKILSPRRHERNMIELRQGVEISAITDKAVRELAVLNVCEVSPRFRASRPILRPGRIWHALCRKIQSAVALL